MEETGRKVTREERKELKDRIQEAKTSIAALEVENDMIESYISLFCPQIQEELSLKEDMETSQLEDKSPDLSDDVPRLTVNQKLYASQKVVEARSQNLKELKQQSEALQRNAKVSSKEAEMRRARIKKERSDFERRIHPRTMNELPSMETKKAMQCIMGKAKASLLVKYVGYNQVLKDKKRKLLAQLQRPDKEDHFQDPREESDDQNSDELQLKYSSIQHNLNSHKDKLRSASQQSTELSDKIAKKEKLLKKVEEDLKLSEEKLLKEEVLVQQLSSRMDDSLDLDVSHYTQVKQKKKILLNSIRAWERKVRVAESRMESMVKGMKYTETADLDLMDDKIPPESTLLIENDMFKHFINLNLTLPETHSLDIEVASLMEFENPSWRRRSRSILSDSFQPLTTQQKLHMSQKVVTATKRDLETLRLKYEAVQNKFKVSSKEAEVRLARIRKEKIEFERKINPVRINGILMLEPSTAVQSLVGKSMPSLLLEYNGINQMLKCKMTKLLQKQQKMKELEEAVFKEVFQDVFEEKIEKDTDELQLKYSEVQHNLDALKEKMKTISQQSVLLSEKFDKQKQLLEKTEEELKFVEEKRVKAEALNKLLRSQVSETLAFDVKAYIQVKDKKKQLQKSVQTWERKVKIAEMVKKSQAKNKQKINKLTRASSARVPHRDLKCAVKLPRTLPGRYSLYSGL